MKVTKFVNSYRQSNTFVLEGEGNAVVIIDVGGPDIHALVKWLSVNGKVIAGVLLTHEHADHCLGINPLYDQHPFPLFCSEICAVNIRNSRQNFSFYTDEIDTFEVNVKTEILIHNQEISLVGLNIQCLATPGHSPGGMCYIINEKYFFTGDTLLNGIKPPLTFPHSNKKDYQHSLLRLSTYLMPEAIIYPGHGDSFVHNDNAKQIIIQQ